VARHSLAQDDLMMNSLLTPQRVDVLFTSVFARTNESEKRIIVSRGGAGSSKSYSMCQDMWSKFLTERKKKILIVRKTLPALRNSVLPAMREVGSAMGVMDRIYEEKVMLNWHYGDNLVHFGSVDDPEKIKCYHPDTEILTKQGFKNIKDVNRGDYVATLNPVTRKAYYKKVVNTFVYDFDGQMYSPVSKLGTRDSHSGFCVTPEHKMLVGFKKDRTLRFVKIKDINERIYIPRSAEWDGKHVTHYTIPSWKTVLNVKTDSKWDDGRKNNVFEIESFLKFLGWFISEGNLSSKGWSIVISQKKDKEKQLICDTIKKLGYRYNIVQNSIRLYSKDLFFYLLQFGKYCYEKRIPRDILELHPELLKHLFETLMLGDGTVTGNNRHVYSTTSRGLADDVSELAIRLGYVATIREGKITAHNYPNARQFWIVSIYKQQDVCVDKLNTSKYKGKVYCLNVEPYNTVMTRFNGKIMWCGQSTDWSYIWMEEATDFTFNDYLILKTRLRTKSADQKRNKMFLTLNPIDEYHWIKTELIDKEFKEVEDIASTYKDNPFLDQDYIDDLEKLANQDANFYRIYTLGEWGRLTNLIYTNWQIIDKFPATCDNIIYGIDFGYNAPSVLLKLGIEGNKVYEHQLIYKNHLTNKDFIVEMKKVIPPKLRMKPIYADSAEPDRIEEIRKAGFNIRGANKKVREGIDFIKRLEVCVTEDSTDVIKEKRGYSWRTDKKGRVIDEPVSFLDHAQDAERYAIYSHLKGVAEYRVRYA